MFSIPFLDLPPLIGASGTVRLPGSKSISNRVLLLAGLSAGTTAVHDLLDSDDTRVMLEALCALGCSVQTAEGATLITGIGGRLSVREATLFLGNAGTAMRPLTAALALLCQRDGGSFELRGVPRMHERPIADLVDALRSLGCGVDYLGDDGYPPLRVHASGDSRSGMHLPTPIHVRGDVSSQFLSALLLALPLATARHSVQLEVVGELISKPYVEITLNLLARFGVEVQRDGWQRFTVPAGSALSFAGRNPCRRRCVIGVVFRRAWRDRCESTRRCASRASAATRSRATSASSTLRNSMGAQVDSGPGGSSVRRGRWPLCRHRSRLQPHPGCRDDLGGDGVVCRRHDAADNIASWRVKETDRIAAMAHRVAQARRDRQRERRQHRGDSSALMARGSDPHLRRPPHRDVLRAGGVQSADRHRNPTYPFASSIHAASARPSPTTSRRCCPWSAPIRRRCR